MDQDHSKLVPTSDARWACDDDGAVALLHLRAGKWYYLDRVAGQFWQGVAEGRPAARIMDDLTRRYNVSSQQLQADLQPVLTELEKVGLLGSAEFVTKDEQ